MTSVSGCTPTDILTEVILTDIPDGRVGLHTEGWTADVDARFDNWRVYRLGALVGK
jgi:hypothetical protein